IVYDTMWGATATLANAVMEVFQDAGIPVVKRCLTETHISEVIVDFLDARYVCIGTPTLNNEMFPRVAAFTTYMKGLKPKNKKAFAFGSYGWKPGVVNQIQKIYEELGWETIPPFEEKYTPKSDVVAKLKEHVKTMIEK
ncbi:MAG: FprA family A-type flavoprotein, partial [Lachnospiraceae bacterium]|nr:FprA family A-type flavoprotein [Lachnospiraceae bacterium]